MAYQEGDTSPPHTNVHNDVRTQLDELSTEFEIPVVLPPVVGLGDVGHVDHHNLFTTAIAELSKHECEDGLEGLGGWAEITEVSGSPKRYAYNDGEMDWVAFEWTADGSLTTQAGGLVEALVVGAGGHGSSDPNATGRYGQGGTVVQGVIKLAASEIVSVGAQDPSWGGGSVGEPSRLAGTLAVGRGLGGTGAGWTGSGNPTVDGSEVGLESAITGKSEDYGRGRQGSPRANKGDGGGQNKPGSDGVVIVRVPAAQAAGVDPGSWVTRIDYYAEVTNGIVTDLYQEKFYGDDTVRTENGRYASPEQPDDLIPCDPTVAEGWTYADGEFTPPPPDPSWREQAIEALQEQIKELQKDTK